MEEVYYTNDVMQVGFPGAFAAPTVEPSTHMHVYMFIDNTMAGMVVRVRFAPQETSESKVMAEQPPSSTAEDLEEVVQVSERRKR